MTRHPEDALQIATADYCRIALHPSVIAHHSANERKGKAAGAKAKAMGQLAGFPDWLFVWSDGTGTYLGFIELKSQGGVLSQAQISFHTKSLINQTNYRLCRSLDEFIAALKEWGVPLKANVQVAA